METGFGGRPSKVIYNRKHSAITRVALSDFCWKKIFTGATWFHISGITLALGKKVRKAAMRAGREAKAAGATVRFDFTSPSTRWTTEEAKPVYQEILIHGLIKMLL